MQRPRQLQLGSIHPHLSLPVSICTLASPQPSVPMRPHVIDDMHPHPFIVAIASQSYLYSMLETHLYYGPSPALGKLLLPR